MRLADIGVPLVDRRFVRVHLAMVAVLAPLVLAQWLVSPPVELSLAMIVLATLAVLRLTRRQLGADATFPELMRVPGMRLLLGTERSAP
jgi:hypothetical protein